MAASTGALETESLMPSHSFANERKTGSALASLTMRVACARMPASSASMPASAASNSA
jgi:hypothetical protein